MNPLYLVSAPIDALARCLQDSNTFSHVTKLTRIAMEALYPKEQFAVYDVFDTFNGVVTATNWVTFTNRSLAQLTAPIVDPIMWCLDEGFNVSMWLSNVRAALEQLKKIDLIESLGQVANKIGSVPVFRVVFDFVVLPGVQNTFAVVAFIQDMAKQVLEIGRHSVNGNIASIVLASVKLAGDVAKIVVIVVTPAAIARALSSGLSVASYLIDNYCRKPWGE